MIKKLMLAIALVLFAAAPMVSNADAGGKRHFHGKKFHGKKFYGKKFFHKKRYYGGRHWGYKKYYGSRYYKHGYGYGHGYKGCWKFKRNYHATGNKYWWKKYKRCLHGKAYYWR